MQNKNYGKKIGLTEIEYAPRKFIEDGNVIVPRIDDDEAYMSRGWYRIINSIPVYDPTKYIAALVDWTVDEQEKTLTSVYEIQPWPPSPTKEVKRFSKLKMTLFCMDQQLWNQVKKFLTKTGYYDLFVMAQYFLESDEYFQRGIAAFKEEFIKDHSEEEFDALIENMCNFAFDGYETIEISSSSNQTTVEDEDDEEQEDPQLSAEANLSGDVGNG